MNEQNKRKHERSPIELAASYGIPDESEDQFSATVINISQGGFCFFSDKPIKDGKEIHLSVDLGPDDQVVVKVKVIWSKETDKGGKYMIGVQIVKSDDEDYQRFLSFYVEEMRKQQDTLE